VNLIINLDQGGMMASGDRTLSDILKRLYYKLTSDSRKKELVKQKKDRLKIAVITGGIRRVK
jgi:hypothetical protein